MEGQAEGSAGRMVSPTIISSPGSGGVGQSVGSNHAPPVPRALGRDPCPARWPRETGSGANIAAVKGRIAARVDRLAGHIEPTARAMPEIRKTAKTASSIPDGLTESPHETPASRPETHKGRQARPPSTYSASSGSTVPRAPTTSLSMTQNGSTPDTARSKPTCAGCPKNVPSEAAIGTLLHSARIRLTCDHLPTSRACEAGYAVDINRTGLFND